MKRGLICLSITAALFAGVTVASADSGKPGCAAACATQGSHTVKQGTADVRTGRMGGFQLATRKEVKLVPAGSAATVAMGVQESPRLGIRGGRMQ